MEFGYATKADIDQLTELRIALALWIRKVIIKKWCLGQMSKFGEEDLYERKMCGICEGIK